MVLLKRHPTWTYRDLVETPDDLITLMDYSLPAAEQFIAEHEASE